MYLLRRLILWLVPIAWLVGLALIKKQPANWWWVLFILVLQLAVTIWFICKRQFSKNFYIFLILPMIFALAGFIFSLFLINNYVFYLIGLLVALVLYLLLKQYYLYFNLPFKYQPYSLETLSLYISLLAAYFLSAAGFGALTLIQFNLVVLLLIIISALGLVIFYFFWIHKVNFSKSWLFTAIILLVLVELFVAVSYLPTSYYVNSFIIVAAFYLMLNLTKLSLTHSLSKRKIINHLIVVGAALLVVLLTAQWE